MLGVMYMSTKAAQAPSMESVLSEAFAGLPHAAPAVWPLKFAFRKEGDQSSFGATADLAGTFQRVLAHAQELFKSPVTGVDVDVRKIMPRETLYMIIVKGPRERAEVACRMMATCIGSSPIPFPECWHSLIDY